MTSFRGPGVFPTINGTAIIAKGKVALVIKENSRDPRCVWSRLFMARVIGVTGCRRLRVWPKEAGRQLVPYPLESAGHIAAILRMEHVHPAVLLDIADLAKAVVAGYLAGFGDEVPTGFFAHSSKAVLEVPDFVVPFLEKGSTVESVDEAPTTAVIVPFPHDTDVVRSTVVWFVRRESFPGEGGETIGEEERGWFLD